MGFFNSSKKGVFSQGKITPLRANKIVGTTGLRSTKKEYIKRTLERFHSPVSRGITSKEFDSAMKELTKNTRDPISPKEVAALKKRFGVK